MKDTSLDRACHEAQTPLEGVTIEFTWLQKGIGQAQERNHMQHTIDNGHILDQKGCQDTLL